MSRIAQFPDRGGPDNRARLALQADVDGFMAAVAASANIPLAAFLASLDRYDPEVVAALKAAVETDERIR
jgi:hypothetical protein